jgi:hypothetical protein
MHLKGMLQLNEDKMADYDDQINKFKENSKRNFTILTYIGAEVRNQAEIDVKLLILIFRALCIKLIK